MAPIGLEELMARAMLQTRIDRKYVLPLSVLHALLEELPPDTRVLEIDGRRRFAYRSLYFDTPDLRSFHLTAHRRRRRFKIRTRVYEQSGECWLEVKTCGPRGSTVKQRLPYDPRHHATVEPGRSFLDGVLAERRMPGEPPPEGLRLSPVLGTGYHRATLCLPDTDSRVTIDTGLRWRDGEQELLLPGMAVVETKTGSTASRVDRLLWRAHYRPGRISKYATGLAALRPELPAGPWRRTLRRDFARAVVRRVPAAPGAAPAAPAAVQAAGEPVVSAVFS
ncbi:polyphosphate polymerase domain-containing protein [Streptomyces aidingensis]|nr:polyphosphate polymerase domain-containing protein [Streptomyces aidingensis]